MCLEGCPHIEEGNEKWSLVRGICYKSSTFLTDEVPIPFRD